MKVDTVKQLQFGYIMATIFMFPFMFYLYCEVLHDKSLTDMKVFTVGLCLFNKKKRVDKLSGRGKRLFWISSNVVDQLFLSWEEEK